MTVGQKLKEFGETRFNSVSEFADALEIKREQLYPYFNNTTMPGGEFLRKLSEMGCDINWLLTGKANPLEGGGIREKTVKYMRLDEVESYKPSAVIEIPLAADVPASSKLREIDFHDYPEYFGVQIDPRNHFAVKVHEEYGYSMSPAISPGDFIICNSNSKIIKDGDLVLVRYDDTMGAIKKYSRNKELKAITLYSTNTAEPPVTIHENKIKQIFKVTHIIKK